MHFTNTTETYRITYMDTLTYSTARAKLASTMDRVCEDHEPLIITRSGKKAVVMMSLEGYKSLEDTASLLRSPSPTKKAP